MNHRNEILLRRYKKNMEISGSATILFGIWGILKTLMTITMNKEEYNKLTEGVDLQGLPMVAVILIYVIVFGVLFGFILLFHFKIGLGAIRYSRGNTKKKGFLLLAVLNMLINFLAFISFFTPFLGSKVKITDSMIAAILVDVTMIFMLFDMLYSAYRIKKLLSIREETR